MQTSVGLNRAHHRHQARRTFHFEHEVDVPDSPFEESSVAEVTGRLQLNSHFSFHDYDGDGRIVRYYAG